MPVHQVGSYKILLLLKKKEPDIQRVLECVFSLINYRLLPFPLLLGCQPLVKLAAFVCSTLFPQLAVSGLVQFCQMKSKYGVLLYPV